MEDYLQPRRTGSASQGSGNSPGSRPSARVPLSCVECSRRKIKCDRKIPCRACFERGDSPNCRRQQVPPSSSSRRTAASTSSSSTHPSLKRRRAALQHGFREELESVRERLDAVEALVGITTTRGRSSAAETEDGRQLKENGLVSAMEEAALGIGENRRWQGASLVVDDAQLPDADHPWFSPTSLASCLATLPARDLSEYLVDSYCDNINWITGCLHRPSLERQHKNFWTLYERDQAPDGMQLAVLFAVLSNAAFFLDEQQARSRGLDPERLLQFARQWFNCSIATFFRCRGISHHSLAACQTILTLRYAFHLTDNSNLHQQLAYVGIGNARAINLHLLGKGVGTEEDSIMREMGRRAWWLLVEGDWDLLPYHRYCFISPQHFNTSLPGLTDEGTSAASTSSAHSLTFLLTCCQSAKVLHEVYGHLSSDQYPLYDAAISASERLDQIVRNLPDEVQQAAESSQVTTGPVYVWRFLIMMMAYRSYIIHRSFFVKSLSEPRYEASRLACIRAAETIISLANKGLPAVFYRLWNTTLWLVAAGLVLAVDLVHAASEGKIYPDIAARRRRLSALVDLLQNSADRTGIGERGANLIRHICAIEHDVLVGSSSKIQLTRDDIFNIVRTQGMSQVSGGAHHTVGPAHVESSVTSGHDASMADQPPSQDHAVSLQFSPPSVDEMADMGFEFANSGFFVPEWGAEGNYGVPGPDATGQNHLDALFADILPNPPT